MKKFEIKKLNFIEIPMSERVDEQKDMVAFQMVEITIDFFGSLQKSIYDTRIMKDGSQFIIGGDGWVKSGYQIA